MPSRLGILGADCSSVNRPDLVATVAFPPNAGAVGDVGRAPSARRRHPPAGASVHRFHLTRPPPAVRRAGRRSTPRPASAPRRPGEDVGGCNDPPRNRSTAAHGGRRGSPPSTPPRTSTTATHGPQNTTRLRRFAIGVVRAHGHRCVAAAMRRLDRNPRRVFDYLRMSENTCRPRKHAHPGGRTNCRAGVRAAAFVQLIRR